MDIVEPLLNDEQGTINSLEMTIQGRPGRVEISGDSVVLIMNYTPDLSANQPQPRGVPQLPPETQRFVVYMGIMSWERVAKFLEQPEDILIVKGRIVYDPQAEAIALMAIGVTTKEIERRQKRDAKAQEQREAAAKAKAQKQKEAARAPKPPKPLPTGAVIPTDAPPEVVETLQKLYQAADTLRQRIATKTQAGQKSSMEEKLLASNEKQIDGLLKQYG